MQTFYRKALVQLLGLFVVSLILGLMLWGVSGREASFFPEQRSDITWYLSANSDADNGGRSHINLHEQITHLNYSFRLSSLVSAPYAGVNLTLSSEIPPILYRDLSQLTQLSFWVTCDQQNILTFTLTTYDDDRTVDGQGLSYRPATTHFSCGPQASRVDIDLRYLEVPSWWLRLNQLNLSDRDYSLEKVTHLNFGVSEQTPRDVSSRVNIESLMLSGVRWHVLFVGSALLLFIWVAFGVWCFRRYTHALIGVLTEKTKTDKQFFARQELSLESQNDKNKNAVLAYMAEEYANPELSIDIAVSTLGINRVKMNAILKEVVGLTFSTYLNKLRLTEAARLLANNQSANVAEIAYSVGYKNVSYFNKLFKDEYSCTPKTFKSLQQETEGVN